MILYQLIDYKKKEKSTKILNRPEKSTSQPKKIQKSNPNKGLATKTAMSIQTQRHEPIEDSKIQQINKNQSRWSEFTHRFERDEI